MDSTQCKDMKEAKKAAIKAIEHGKTYVHIIGNSKVGYRVWSGHK